MQPDEMRALRKGAGMTLKDLADELGMNIDTVGRMERGVPGYPIEKRTARAIRAIIDDMPRVEAIPYGEQFVVMLSTWDVNGRENWVLPRAFDSLEAADIEAEQYAEANPRFRYTPPRAAGVEPGPQF